MVKVDELVERAQETFSGRRVFGDPIQQNGVTVLPAADVVGGGGGGGGHDEEGQEGMGGGFGLRARPAGVYVIDGGKVRWQPAVDVNRLLSTLASVAIASLFYRWRMAAIRARTVPGGGWAGHSLRTCTSPSPTRSSRSMRRAASAQPSLSVTSSSPSPSVTSP